MPKIATHQKKICSIRLWTYYQWKNQLNFFLPNDDDILESLLGGINNTTMRSMESDLWESLMCHICLLCTIILNMYYNLIVIPLILDTKYYDVLYCIWSLIDLSVCILCSSCMSLFILFLVISFIKCNCSNMEEIKIINQSIQ
jgi:hypothetical protein